jgi:hypothetical protein
MTDASSLTALFRVPPEQFTTARNRLVAELRRAGEVAVAASVAKLARPTPVVWAINQAVHREPAAVARLVEATDRLKQAQLGHGSVDVAASVKAYREAVEALVERSLTQLTDAGRSTTAAVRTRLTQTLMASVTDTALRESLRAGRLSREEVSAGFDVFGPTRPTLRALTARGKPPPPPSKDREEARRRAELELRLRTARADLARVQERARELERREADEARSAAEARERAATAREAAAQGRAEVKRAEAKVRAAEDAARGPATK